MKNAFVIMLCLAVVVAWFFPEWTYQLPFNAFITIGVALIFFFYGTRLSPTIFLSAVGHYRLHLLIQATTFLVFPLLILVFYPLAEGKTWFVYWQAFFFLAAVPSTVSSSVILVSLAKGNVPAAIFNASLSGVLGIIFTPFWLGFFVATEQIFSFGEIGGNLVFQILFPLILGFWLRRYLEGFVNRYRHFLSLFDKSVIVLIVFVAFSGSFLKGSFAGLGVFNLILLILVVLALFFLVYFGQGLLARRFGFSRADQITAKFCGAQKSLVHGSVMGKVILGGSAAMGLFLLPLIMYHFVQLLVVSFFAEQLNQKASGKDKIL